MDGMKGTDIPLFLFADGMGCEGCEGRIFVGWSWYERSAIERVRGRWGFFYVVS